MAEWRDTDEKSEILITTGSNVVCDIMCIPCSSDGKTSEANGYCIDCCEHLCDDCIRYHKRFGLFKQHEVVNKNNVPKKQHVVPPDDTCTKRCQIHSDEVIKYFCPNHNVLGCSACVTLKHRLCQDIQYIPEVAKDIETSRDYKDFQSKLNTLIDKALGVIDYTKENIEYSNGQSLRVLQDIEAFRQHINSQLDKIEEEIKRKTIETKERDSLRLESVIIKSNEVLSELNGISSEFEKLKENKQLCQMFTGLKDSSSKLSDLEDVLEQIHDEKMSYYKFVPNESLQTLLDSIEGLGKLCLRDAKHIRVVHESDIRVGSPMLHWGNGITGATLISPDKLVIADYSSKCIKLIDTVRKKVTAELKLQSRPWDVAAVNNNQVAVTLPGKERIVFLTCDSNEIVLGTGISVHGRCRGLTCYRDKLFVEFCVQKKVEMLSMSGEVLQRFQTNDQGEQLFQDPTYVAVSPDGRYMFVSDWSSDTMIKIGMDGKVVSKYLCTELLEPRKLVLDRAGLIYLCGRFSNNVHLLSPECRKLKLLLTESDGMDRPSFPCYCEATDKLYIGLARERVVKVYKLSHGP